TTFLTCLFQSDEVPLRSIHAFNETIKNNSITAGSPGCNGLNKWLSFTTGSSHENFSSDENVKGDQSTSVTDPKTFIVQAFLRDLEVPRAELKIEVTILVVLMIAGVPSNAFIIIVLITSKNLRKSNDLMIFSQALSDLIITMVTHPMSIYTTIVGNGNSGAVEGLACDVVSHCFIIGMGATWYSSSLVALNYFYSTRPHSKMRKILKSRLCVIFLLVLAWVIPTVITVIPHITGYALPGHVPVWGVCKTFMRAPQEENITIGVTIVTVFLSVINLIVCSFFYAKVLVFMYKRTFMFPNSAVQRQFEITCKLIMPTFVLMAICLLPLTIIGFVDPLMTKLASMHTLLNRLIFYICVANSSINPFISFFKHKPIRQAAFNLCFNTASAA
ncbi:unnamed protein product, partial [Owenia fusiformis]